LAYISDSAVQIGAWVAFGAESEIEYQILPETGTIEFTLGGRHGLDLEMDEVGLRRCISAFAGALNELTRTGTTGIDRLPEARRVDVTETLDRARRGGDSV
jgi:hypothetical protein